MVYWLKRPFFDQFFICLVFAKTSVQGFYVSSRCTLETLKQTLRFDRKKATILSRKFFGYLLKSKTPIFDENLTESFELLYNLSRENSLVIY